MIKFSVAAGFALALLGCALASPEAQNLLRPVLRPLFGPADVLVTPGVTTVGEIRQERPFRNVVHAAGDEFWRGGDSRLDVSRLQVSIAILKDGSVAPAKLSQVAILRFDGRTGVLKSVYLGH
jgi:hypothetical protein